VTEIEQLADQKTVRFKTEGGEDRSVSADSLLIATGRRANTAGMGLEEAGVELGPGGEIVVNEFLQSTNPSVYAAGDVTGEPMHVYVAAQDASRAAANALHGDSQAVDRRVVPEVVFTDPAVAVVGLTEAQARIEGQDVITSLLSLEHVPRSLAAQDTRGFIKLVATAQTRRIIGAQILAAEAGEMIMEPTLAVKHGLSIDDLVSTLHPYLTLAEGVKLAALAFDKSPAELSCCAA
jgi:mercuric reductase